jgi:hydroxyacylglutathione hydrolase
VHVVQAPIPVFSACGGQLAIHAVPAATDNLVWIAVAGDEVALIDGPSAGEALAACDRLGLVPTQVWITHTHGDHVGIARDLAGRLPIIGCADRAGDIPGITRGVREGDTVPLGSLIARVLRTDGHLNGHLSYWIPGDDGAVFCGDTLFAGGCGRLFDGPPAAMLDSLLRLAALPPGTAVCCGHEYTQDNLRFARSVEPANPALAARIARVDAVRAGGGCTLPSTIGEERETNPFLRPGSPSIRAAGGGGGPLAVFAAIRALKDSGAYRRLE